MGARGGRDSGGLNVHCARCGHPGAHTRFHLCMDVMVEEPEQVPDVETRAVLAKRARKERKRLRERLLKETWQSSGVPRKTYVRSESERRARSVAGRTTVRGQYTAARVTRHDLSAHWESESVGDVPLQGCVRQLPVETWQTQMQTLEQDGRSSTVLGKNDDRRSVRPGSLSLATDSAMRPRPDMPIPVWGGSVEEDRPPDQVDPCLRALSTSMSQMSMGNLQWMTGTRDGDPAVSYLSVNARKLIHISDVVSNTSSSDKLAELSRLLHAKRWPDLVGITEVGGSPRSLGLADIVRLTAPDLWYRYDVHWSFRSVAADGVSEVKGSGGGIALLVKRSLHVATRMIELHVPSGQDHWLHGHVRLWHLEPIKPEDGQKWPSAALWRPVSCAVSYMPPVGQNKKDNWGRQLIRSSSTRGMIAAAEAMQRLRQSQDAFSVMMTHHNAPDGGCKVPVVLRNGVADYQAIQVRLRQLEAQTAARSHRPSRLDRVRACRAKLVFENPTGELWLHPRQSRNARKTTKAGEELTIALAATGLIPLVGVLAGRQSTSWTLHSCPPGLCQCKRKRAVEAGKEPMRNVLEHVWIPSDLVVQSLLAENGGKALLSHHTERIPWAVGPSRPDHAVTVGHFRLAAPRVSDTEAQSDTAKPMKRQRLPTETLRKRAVLKDTATIAFKLCRERLKPRIIRLFNRGRSNADTMNGQITQVLREALTVATQAAGETKRTKDARVVTAEKGVKKAWRQLRLSLKQRARVRVAAPAGTRARVKRAVRKAFQGCEWAVRRLRRVASTCHAKWLAETRRSAPLEFWKAQHAAARDPSSVARAAATPHCQLLDRLNDDEGHLISVNKAVIMGHLSQYRRGVHAMPAHLPDKCERRIDEALAVMSEVNARVMRDPACKEFDQDASVARSARDASSPMADADRARGFERHLDTSSWTDSVAAAIARGEQIRRTHPAAVLQLERPPEYKELVEVFRGIRDVGAGTDGISPAVLRFLADVPEPDDGVDATSAQHREKVELFLQEGPTQQLLELLRRAWDTNRNPDEWQEHRGVLCYKGKGADYHAMDSYRGLGLCNLGCKILDLIMAHRLQAFCASTGTLSGAQGGFLPGRGCPEQIFTLSESVRGAITRSVGAKPVHLNFVDIKRAYDTVVHVILWQRCVEHGIGGKFLSALQAMYHRATSVLDVGDSVLEPVPIHCGVLQGSPLSPTLFNIYINPTLKAMEEEAKKQYREGRAMWGVPLPRVQRRGVSGVANPRPTAPLAMADPGAVLREDDYLPCLFFADDGVLIALDRKTLQAMTDFLAESLAEVGLFLNAGKTKWMVVAPADMPREAYETLCAAQRERPLMVGDKTVELVEEFRYLGAILNWRWNWASSWKAAQDRAKAMLGKALGCGFQRRAGSMHAQLAFLKGTVFTHFDYISAVAGAGGCLSDKTLWSGNEDVVTSALRVITGCRFVKAEALRIEAGVWDQRSRIDKLLLRFWAKLVTAPVDSTHYRAMCLSMESVLASQAAHPETTDASAGRVHRQPWAQSLFAAAQRFGIPLDDVRRLRPGLVVLQRRDAPVQPWISVDHPDDRPLGDAAGPGLAVEWRAVCADMTDLPEDRHQKGFTWWPVPTDVLRARFFHRWQKDGPLQLATYASLQRRGNRHRHQAVDEFLQKCRDNRPGFTMLRRYAAITTDAFGQAYWHLPETDVAKRMTQLRFDLGPYEGHVRRRDQPEREGRMKQRRLPRLEEPRRACYLCGLVDPEIPDVYWAETQEHMLTACAGLARPREVARGWLKDLAYGPAFLRVAHSASVAIPDFDSDTTLLMVLRLATATCSPLLHRALVVGDALDKGARAMQQRDGLPQFDVDNARCATRWVRALMDDWMAGARDPRQDVSKAPGYLLACWAAGHAQIVCSIRRRLLRRRADFHRRDRDPASCLGAPARDDPACRPAQLPVARGQAMGEVVPPVVSGPGVHQVPEAIADGCGLAPRVMAVPVVDCEAAPAPSRCARVQVPPAPGDTHAAVELLTGLRRSRRRRQDADPEVVTRTGDCGARGGGALGAGGLVCADRR